MNLSAFVIYSRFSQQKPDDVHPARWQGMLKWLAKRIADGDLEIAVNQN